MPYLLDTHVLLWWLSDSPDLKQSLRAVIADGKNLICVSAASAWEISIKKALGKLEVPEDLPAALVANRFQPLPISIEHALLAGSLPMHHRDPFDRLLIAQAIIEQLTLITQDERLKHYDVRILR